MITKTKRPQTLLLSAALLMGSNAISQQVHSQASDAYATSTNRVDAPQEQPKEPEEGTTNIVKKLANLPILKTNDPFANTFEMLKRAATDNPISNTIATLSGNSGLRLKGSVVDGSNQKLALIEVGNTGVHVVREGDTLRLSSGGRSANVTIRHIHRQSVEVEFGKFEDSVIIR